jgi:hypothetical protein
MQASLVALPLDGGSVAIAKDGLPSARLTTVSLNGLTAWAAIKKYHSGPGRRSWSPGRLVRSAGSPSSRSTGCPTAMRSSAWSTWLPPASCTPVAGEFAVDEARAAYQEFASGPHRGRIVLTF